MNLFYNGGKDYGEEAEQHRQRGAFMGVGKFLQSFAVKDAVREINVHCAFCTW